MIFPKVCCPKLASCRKQSTITHDKGSNISKNFLEKREYSSLTWQMPFYRSSHPIAVQLGRYPAQLFRCFVVTQQCRKLLGFRVWSLGEVREAKMFSKEVDRKIEERGGREISSVIGFALERI